MDTPTYTSEGIQVYKPQPGEYWKDGLRFRESFGGIIAEIQDQIVAKTGSTAKTYPQNFAGIIAALNDLGALITEGNLPDVAEYPPNWDVTNQGWQGAPLDGSLWFDTRQGRLFIAIEGEYWQANGGDGITEVGPAVPTNPPVIGSTWFNTEHSVLYVYVGEDDNGAGLWEIVKGAGEASLTTATLPLATSRSAFEAYTPNIIPPVPIETMEVQKDYNEYIYDALITLDEAVTDSSVNVSTTPPTENVVSGTLWYDSESLDLSIWYEDDDGGQWVPTAVSYAVNQELDNLKSQIEIEEDIREAAISAVRETIETLKNEVNEDVLALIAKNTIYDDHIANHPVNVDLSPYSTIELVNTNISNLVTLITQVENSIPDLAPYATTSSMDELEAEIAALPTVSEVNTLITAAAPNLASFVAQTDIDTAIDNLAIDYLPRTGGTLSGGFIIEKTNTTIPAIDFSSEKWYSNLTHKYATNSSGNNYATFGTNNNLYEYAWDFTSNEDFCWNHDSSKVFSISKDGPACTNLFIGNFQENTNDGRVITNKIDVKDRLTKYQTAFESIRQAVSDSTDYSTLRSGLLTALAGV